MNEIGSEKDIEYLMEVSGGFHDSCIVSASYSSGMYVNEEDMMIFEYPSDHTLSIVINSQWCKPIRLLFSGVRKFGVTGWRDNYSGEIYGAHLSFRTDLLGKCRDDRLIVWADEGNFDPAVYSEEKLLSHRSCTYVVAEKLCWEFIK